ncbi:MAG: hypothetical protein JW839_12455 [Candidatus Lokiarchaeota archaeon]|nr:hypothetical protein [Candidatus Lokiarchaeota archaeon]
MSYRHYREIADQERVMEPEEIDQVIKYNVLPTLAGGTLLFCFTMFVTYALPYDFGWYLLSIAAYIGLAIATFSLAIRRMNGPALLSFYGLSFAAGFLQRPVLLFASQYLGSFELASQLFAVAVLAATAVIVAITIMVRAFPSFFSPGRGFMRVAIWVAIFGLLGISIWSLSALFLGGFDVYLLVSSIVSVFMVGIFTIVDIHMLRYRVAVGQWVYGTASLAINYFVLIVRIFLILVIGGGRRRS